MNLNTLIAAVIPKQVISNKKASRINKYLNEKYHERSISNRYFK